MNATLKAFLVTNDLDDLWEAKEELSILDLDNQAEITRVLQEWTDTQAVANLLMYPDLIPEAERSKYVLAGLRESLSKYLVLAAVVGLGQLDIGALPAPLITEVIDRIIAVTKCNSGVIAERASIFLAERLWHFGGQYAPQIVELLDHPSKVVQHNTLVALIPLVGLEIIRKFLADAVQQGQLSVAGQLAAEQKLSMISGFSKDNTVDSSQFDLDLLSTPLLAYIPNFNEMAH
jgi:hypothetical protein